MVEGLKGKLLFFWLWEGGRGGDLGEQYLSLVVSVLKSALDASLGSCLGFKGPSQPR